MVKGQLTVDVGYGEQANKLPLLVVEGKGPSLLGRDWLLEIRIDWQELWLHTVQTTHQPQTILNNHLVFTKELGRLKGVQAKIHIEPDATPIFKGPRSIPFAL